MKRKIDSRLLAAILIGLIFFGTVAVVGWQSPTRSAYEGKVLFETEQEYSQFKYEIGRADVDLQEIEVLSSSPPIVVQFRVSVPKDVSFPYGTRDSEMFVRWLNMLLAGMMGGGFGVFVYIVFPKSSNPPSSPSR